jgi:hypothetical protein
MKTERNRNSNLISILKVNLKFKIISEGKLQTLTTLQMKFIKYLRKKYHSYSNSFRKQTRNKHLLIHLMRQISSKNNIFYSSKIKKTAEIYPL